MEKKTVTTYKGEILSPTSSRDVKLQILHTENVYPVRVNLHYSHDYKMDLQQLEDLGKWITDVANHIRQNQDPEALKEVDR